MNAEQVIDKILAEARQKAQILLDEARQNATEHQARQQEQLSAYEAETQTLAQAAARDRRDRILAGARMEVRKQVLAAKGRGLDEVFARARKTVNTLPDDEYRRLMETMLVAAVQTGDEELIVGRQESRLNGDFLKQVNRRLGDRGRLTLSERRADIDGGFLLRRGKVQINASTEVLIDQLREEMEPELAGDLFPEESKQ